MPTFPALASRPSALLAAGGAAWPLAGYALVGAAGVDGCVRAHGVAGFLAHGAMLRPVAACPSGSVGLPSQVAPALGFLVAAAIMTTLAHVLIAIIGTRGAEWVHRLADALARLVAPKIVLGRIPVQACRGIISRQLHPLTSAWQYVPWQRGPPAAAAVTL